MAFPWVRLPFPVAAALFAAALGDPLLERIARTGVFGPGYGDDDHAGVLPALVCFAALAFLVAARRLATSLRASSPFAFPQRGSAAGTSDPRALARLVGLVFTFELAAVFAMETLETHLSGAAPHAGVAWLGAPAAIALAFHLCASVLATFAVGIVLRATVAKLASLVLRAIELVALLLRPRGPAALALGRARSLVRAGSPPAARHAGGRAPPPLPRPA